MADDIFQKPPPELSRVANLGFDDMEAAINMRRWLQRACETAGGKMTGGSFGGGVADIDIELEGHRYNIAIRAIRAYRESR